MAKKSADPNAAYDQALKCIQVCRNARAKTLDLSELGLSSVPPELFQLTALTDLDLSNNQLTALPSEIGQLTALIDLNLEYNKLTTLPSEIGRLTALNKLYLSHNPSLNIPDDIIREIVVDVWNGDSVYYSRPQDILNFYFSRLQSEGAGTLRPLNELKVMLVGRGGAGKTSLRRFFMNQPHDNHEKETTGIALDSFSLQCARAHITVRLWDFAGQEITHALHQFFLTKSCVYILVLDPRSNTEMLDAEYWLKILKRYAASSPVLVAMNHQDARQGGYDLDQVLLQELFPFIHSFTPTNCEDRETCKRLKQRLCNAIEKLPPNQPPYLQVPQPWLKIVHACDVQSRSLPQPPRNKMLNWLGFGRSHAPVLRRRHYLTLEEFRALCVDQAETEPSKQESLARLLHTLGIVLHFIDEPRLRDTAVLNPHWVTDGVYRLLRFKDAPDSDGTLTLSEALQALPEEEEKEVRFLLRLMERFEMCFPLDEDSPDNLPTKWLIPAALDESQPRSFQSVRNKAGSVRLRYVYDPLPEGVIPRFIVMTHPLSEGQPRWRNGVVLQDGTASALIRRGDNRNHIDVTAFGPDSDRLRLLEIIQGNFDRIHADLPDPKPISEMELTGLSSPGVFRPVADLEAAELGKQKVAVDTPQGKALVDPTPQLNFSSEPEVRADTRPPLNVFLSYSHHDKKAKGVFQQNLTVMTKKKFITPWHDGLIEPDTLWREQITDNLEKMDIFVGLLTTEFLASDFIEKVELKAAREKLRQQGKEFLFVLIMVEEVSLDGLDLAQYQIMRPAGKAVDNHPSRRAGFNQAQAELEKLIRSRQASKKSDTRDNPEFHRQVQKPQAQPGITYIVQGHLIQGPITMHDDHSINIAGNITNAQVGQTLTNCTNQIQQQSPGQKKDLLESLARDIRQLIEKLPADKKEEAPQVAKDLEALIEQATSPKPNPRWYSASAKGLLDAAQWVAEFTAPIAATITTLTPLLGLPAVT